MELIDPLSTLPGVGDKLSAAFAAKDIITIEDLLLYIPRKYIDYGAIVPIAKLRPGQVMVVAKISSVSLRRGRRGLSITEAIASDDSGSLRLIWFNQPYRKASIKSDSEYILSGTFKLSKSQFSLINPSLELIEEAEMSTKRITPIYAESKSLSSWQVRRAEQQAIVLAQKLNDPLPDFIVRKLKLMPLASAITQIHFPSGTKELNLAQKRLNFDGLFPLLLANQLTNIERAQQKAPHVRFKLDLAQDFVKKLPFKLTDDQRRVIWRIYLDMERDLPMNRLVEGDVGSGKTVVAVMSAVMALAEGYKVAFLAPTELLARQHFDSIGALLDPLGLKKHLFLLSGSMKNAQKQSVITAINKQKAALVVGTHSLLSSAIDWHNLALVIVDEQHRFGVDQRLELVKKAGYLPHFLSITATPIPRSLALTIFNDLDLSRLRELPAGRQPISSELVFPSDSKRYFDTLSAQLNDGRQAYIVCPYISGEGKNTALAAETIYTQYSQKFKKFRVRLLHAQLSPDEQSSVMADFASGKVDLLVATTVIEVGVDVANATVMAIYGPERFGLAQLHQLRGRVGRGAHKSHCFLVLSDTLDPPSRLRQFVSIADGFRLSEIDLNLRGPGSVYGKLQHGKGMLPMLTLDDQDLIESVHSAVALFIEQGEKLVKYPELSKRVAMAREMTYLN